MLVMNIFENINEMCCNFIVRSISRRFSIGPNDYNDPFLNEIYSYISIQTIHGYTFVIQLHHFKMRVQTQIYIHFA